jgi:hypothetical protein
MPTRATWFDAGEQVHRHVNERYTRDYGEVIRAAIREFSTRADAGTLQRILVDFVE